MHEKNILTTNIQWEDFELFVALQVGILLIIDTNPRSQLNVQQQSKKTKPCARIIKQNRKASLS